MLLEPQCTGSITSIKHPLCPEINFFGRFLLRLSLIKPSQVVFMIEFSPRALNFGYDFVLLVHFFGTPCMFSASLVQNKVSKATVDTQYSTIFVNSHDIPSPRVYRYKGVCNQILYLPSVAEKLKYINSVVSEASLSSVWALGCGLSIICMRCTICNRCSQVHQIQRFQGKEESVFGKMDPRLKILLSNGCQAGSYHNNISVEASSSARVT